jgi:hypothetical protein
MASKSIKYQTKIKQKSATGYYRVFSRVCVQFSGWNFFAAGNRRGLGSIGPDSCQIDFALQHFGAFCDLARVYGLTCVICWRTLPSSRN